MPQVLWRQVRSRGLLPEWDVAIQEVGNTMDKEIKPDVLSYFNRIVAPWKEENRPSFKAIKRITRRFVSLYVSPRGPGKKIWEWVSITGTREHDIPVKDAKWLRFIWGGPGSYKARTTRSGGYKGPGMPTGTWRKRKIVRHPGFEPRNFETWIGRWYKRPYRRKIENAFRRGIRKAKARARSL